MKHQINNNIQVSASVKSYSASAKDKTNWTIYAKDSTHQNLSILIIFYGSWLERNLNVKKMGR